MKVQILGNAVCNTNENKQHCQGRANQAELKVFATGGVYADYFCKHFPQHSTVSFPSCNKINSYFLLCVC